MVMARMAKTVKKDMSPRSSLSIFLCMAASLLPVVLADAGPLGTDVDGDKVELPEAAQVAASCHRDIERRPDLDAACVAWAGYLVGEPLHIPQLAGEEGEQGVRLPAGAAVQLDLFYDLVCHMVHLLLDGYDVEDIDDECHQHHGH